MKSTRRTPHTVLVASLAAALVSCSSPVEIVPDRHTRPALVDGTRAYSQIVAGFIHTCGLAGGVAYCWGSNEYAQLGARTATTCEGRPCSRVPVEVSGGLRFVSLAAGWVQSCGINADGRAHCWGGGAFTPAMVPADSSFASVTIGDGHTCGLTTSGMAFCWGQNAFGQVGDGTRTDRTAPVAVATPLRFRSISAGANHTCGVTTSDQVFCWGDNRWGQLGAGDVASSDALPVAVRGGAFVSVAAGWEHTCATALDGEAFCWGRNDNASQLGDDSQLAGRGVPGPVSGGVRFSALYAGALTTCGRTPSNDVLCWGGNYYGGLGNGDTDRRGVGHPVRTDGGPFASVSIGQSHACALATDRRLWCWGDQSLGQF